MKLSRILPALALTIMAGHAYAGPTWHTSTIKMDLPAVEWQLHIDLRPERYFLQ